MSLFHRKKNSQPAPEWTPFSNMTDFDTFIGWVRKYFDKKKLSYTIEADLITTQGGNWPFDKMGIANLAQFCNQNPQSEWRSIISNHFDSMLKNAAFEADFAKRSHDYAYASPFIGVRVYPNDYLSHLPGNAYIQKPIAEDLSAVVVFDFPHSVVNLKPETAAHWGRSAEQLMEIGLANIRINYPSKVVTEELNGSRVWIIQGDHFFVANSVLQLPLYDIPSGKNGCIIGLPHRHAVLVYPITDVNLIEALPNLAYITKGMYHEGPGSISERLYWHRDGQLTSLNFKMEENNFHFTPGEEFFEVMNHLPAGPRP